MEIGEEVEGLLEKYSLKNEWEELDRRVGDEEVGAKEARVEWKR